MREFLDDHSGLFAPGRDTLPYSAAGPPIHRFAPEEYVPVRGRLLCLRLIGCLTGPGRAGEHRPLTEVFLCRFLGILLSRMNAARMMRGAVSLNSSNHFPL